MAQLTNLKGASFIEDGPSTLTENWAPKRWISPSSRALVKFLAGATLLILVLDQGDFLPMIVSDRYLDRFSWSPLLAMSWFLCFTTGSCGDSCIKVHLCFASRSTTWRNVSNLYQGLCLTIFSDKVRMKELKDCFLCVQKCSFYSVKSRSKRRKY